MISLSPKLEPEATPSEAISGSGTRFRLGSLDFFGVVARSMERESSAWLAVLTFVYLVTTSLRAGKAFWFDEITTFYLARMESISAAWRTQTDLQPPLMLALAHWSQILAGQNELATRLPSILGVLFACACIYVFLRRRSGTIFATCGSMLILLTSAYHYAIEARPYGVVLAGAALALMSWQSATEQSRRRLSLPGITVGLSIALASQCWTVLLVIPFGVAEVVRSVRRGKIDWPVWWAFALSTAPLVFYPPLIQLHNQGFATKQPMFEPTFRSLWLIPSHMMGGAGRVIAVVLVLVAWLRGREQARTVQPPRIPVHEMVAVVLLAALPLFLQLITAELHTSIFYRYCLAAVLGMVILTVQAFERVAGGDKRIGALILLLLTGVFVERFVSDALGKPDMQPPAKLADSAGKTGIRVAAHPLLAMAREDLPLVVANPIWFPQVAHYAPAGLAAQTYYLTDPAAAQRFSDSDFFEYAVPVMFRFHLPGHAVPYSAFTATHRRFQVYTSSNGFDWLLGKLRMDNTAFRFMGRGGDALLLEACLHCMNIENR